MHPGALLLAAALLAPARPPDDGLPAATARAVDALVASYVERARIPGGAVAIVRDGRVVKVSTWGKAEVENGVPVGPGTAFPIASVTKIFAGILVAQLAAEGRLDPDAGIVRWFPDAPADLGKVTVRQLATHTSGLPPGDVDPDAPLAEAVRAVLSTPLEAPPGTRATYGLVDFVLLARVLELASGMDYERLLRERVLAPLRLWDTRYEHAADQGRARVADLVPGRATTYAWSGGRLRRYAFAYPPAALAAGGLFSSVRDLATLLAAIQSGTLLPPAAREILLAPATLADGRPAGFAPGLVVSRPHGRLALGHSGGPALADVLLLPAHGLGVVVLSNQRTLAPQLAEAVADLLLPPPPPGPPAIADGSPAATGAFRSLLEGMARGRIDPGVLAPALGEAARPELEAWGPVSVGLRDPLASLELLEESPVAGGMTRLYRARFGAEPVLYRVRHDAAGAVADFDPE